MPDNLTVDDLGAGSAGKTLPVVLTPDVQQCLDVFRPWLTSKNVQPFLLVGPEGCGKELLLRYGFEQLRSAQVSIIHCNAQTSAMHVIQKLTQVCMVISTNTGRVYRPRDSEKLILYLKDINLPKPDKWGTSQLIAFLQQASHRIQYTCTYAHTMHTHTTHTRTQHKHTHTQTDTHMHAFTYHTHTSAFYTLFGAVFLA